SSLIAKRLAPFHPVLCAAPSLIERVGVPERPEDLTEKPCIVDTNSRSRNNWHFRNTDGSMMTVAVRGSMEINSPVATKHAALAGLGFCNLPGFIAEEEIERGNLVTCLEDFIVKDGGIYIVYPHRR